MLQHAPSHPPQPARRLLVVQHNPFVARSLARYLAQSFDHVEIALTPAQAEAVLGDPVRTPTHLVCGQNFGPSSPCGSDLIASWRVAFPGVSRAVLATSAQELPECLPGIDAVYLKPSHPAGLLATLG